MLVHKLEEFGLVVFDTCFSEFDRFSFSGQEG